MTADEQLREIFSRQSRTPVTLCWAEVLSVDEKNGTMDAKGISDDLEYYDVYLDCGSFMPVPAIGSRCVIAMIEGVSTECLLISAEKIEKLKVNSSSEIVFNDGTNGGLVKVKELTDILNGIIDTFNGHTHTVAGVMPGSGAVTAPAPMTSMIKVEQNNIENKRILQ